MSVPADTFWTDGNIAILRRLWGEGWSAGQIANFLAGGISRSAVIGKVHRLKLGGRATVVTRPNPRHVKREGAARTKPVAPRPKPEIAARPVEKRLPNGSKVAGADADGMRLLRSRAWKPLPDTVPVRITDHTCGCRWPIDEAGETLFCNAEASGKRPYCATHTALAAPVHSHHSEDRP